jgi:carboxymethylenebutenolidase
MRTTLPSGTPVEVALPPASATRGVVVIPDIWGLRPLFDELVAGLASQHGWAVATFEPFPGQSLETIDQRFDAVAHLSDDRIIQDAVASANLLQEKSGCTRVAAMGFCMGGMYAYKVLKAGRFDRAVSFYGMIRVPVAWRGEGQSQPLDVLAEAQAVPVLSIIGERDPYTPPEDVAALRAASPNVSVVGYPDAEHGFVHDPERDAHRPGDASDAWQRTVAFLA